MRDVETQAGPAFRHAAPTAGADLVPRPRLVDVVRGRFDRRLTVVTAGAGFGKTTLLAQAVAENEVDGYGTDAWLQIVPEDADRDHLLAGIDASLSGRAGSGATSVDDVVERVWARAPEHVALILDDTHLLGPHAEAWTLLRHVLTALPANGHLVVAGRIPPPLPIGRLQAADAALVLDERALAFTEDELVRFAALRSLSPELLAELPPWPALAALVSAAGHSASTGYLWEEVLSALPEERCELLALAACFGIIDDMVVGAIAPDRRWTAARLLDALPLVDADGAGAYRLHALWHDVLDPLLDADQRRATLRQGAEALLAAGHHRRAAAAWAAAGDTDGVHRAVRDFAVQEIAAVTMPDVVALLEMLPTELRRAPVGTFLDAARHWASSSRQSEVLFDHTVRLAEETGDAEMESIAWWRLVQLRYLDDPDQLEVVPRMEQLAATGVPLSSSTPAFIRSVRAQREGRVADALKELDVFDAFDPDQRLAAVSWRLLDLGRPEAVPGSIDTILGPGAIDLVGSQALWLRGEVDPESAWWLAAQFPDVAGRKGVSHEQMALRSIIATIAMAAGDFPAAARILDTARRPKEVVGVHIRQFVHIADALLALCSEGEDAALAHLQESLDEVPIGRFPTRPQFHALALLRALVPGAEALDDCDLGPSLLTAVEAGAAVAALRSGDTTPAHALPWTRPNLLRAHVPLPLLAELAIAAGDDPAARTLLDQLPHRATWLRRITLAHEGEIRARALDALGAFAQRPPYDLTIRTLGGLAVERSDGVPLPAGWDNRERVCQLLALVLVQRRVSRASVAAELWPDLPPAKAAANLRVNLRHLQQALQPDRPADAAPWFLRSEDDCLVLSTEAIEVDADGFDEHIAAAVRAEAAGAPSVALAEYEAACALYGGDYCRTVDHPDVDVERLRLRSLAQAAACRRGELVLARGEPEAAMQLAAEAQRLDSLCERAHRLFIRCHLAVGSVSSARTAGRNLLDTLTAAGLLPEDETSLLLRRLQLRA